MRFASVFLAAALLNAPDRVPVTLTVALHPAGMPPAGTVEALPVGRDRAERTPPVKAELSGGKALVDLTPGMWHFRASMPGYFVPPVTADLPSAANGVLLDAWKTSIVRGTFATQEKLDRPPVISVRWKPRAQTPRGAPGGTVPCTVDGNAWSCEVPAGAFDLRLGATGFVPEYKWDVVIDAAKPLGFGVYQLRRGASLAGTVRLGRGVKGAAEQVEVELRRAGGTPVAVVRPNRRGFFRFEGLESGAYRVSARMRGAASASIPADVRANAEAELIDPLSVELPHRLALHASPPIAPSGRPWRLTLLRYLPGRNHTDLVAASELTYGGTWEYDRLPPGDYAVRIAAAGEDALHEEKFTVDTSDVRLDIDIPLRRVAGTLTYGGTRIPGTVWVGGERSSIRTALTADDDGTFAGAVSMPRQAQWLVTVKNERLGLSRTFLQDVHFDGDEHPTVDIALPATRLRGTVVDETGAPVEALVNVARADEVESVLQAQADRAGHFEFAAMPAGKLNLSATSYDNRQSDTQEVDLQSDADVQVRLIVRPQHALHGRVVSALGPVPGATVVALPTDVVVQLVPQGTTDAAGRFDIDLPPGTQEIDLSVRPPGFSYKSFHAAVPKQAIVLQVDQQGGTLEIDANALVPTPTARHTFLLHRGTVLNAIGLAYFPDVRTQPSKRGEKFAHLSVPLMEPGPYTLCSGTPAELPAFRAGAVPRERCVSGVLAPYGVLELVAPAY